MTGGASADTLDVAYQADTAMCLVWLAIRNCLTEAKEDGSLGGELAESWESTADARTWTFKLRKGVQFHSGKPVTANDVVASFNYHRTPSNKSYAFSMTREIADVKADGAQTVVFTLSAGNADFPWVVSLYSFQIGPSSDGQVDWQSGDGTGGYVLKDFRPGVSSRLVRFPDYWKGDERAHFDEVEIFNIADSVARETALLSKEVDAITRPNLTNLKNLTKSGDIRVVEVISTQYCSTPMDARVAPFDNNDVRRALKYAIDREQLVKLILDGHGLPGNDNPIGPAYRYYASDIERIAYDPDKAKFHLKQAGLTSLSVELKTAPGAWPAGPVDSAILFAEHAKLANIEINVSRLPDDGYWTDVWLQAPFCMSYMGGRPTADLIFQQYFAGTSEFNECHWKNGRFDKLLLAARTELDDAKRKELYRECQIIVRDEGATIIPLYSNLVFALSDKIATGEKLSAQWEFDNWRGVERWWSA